jgi:hypothetical protein
MYTLLLMPAHAEAARKVDEYLMTDYPLPGAQQSMEKISSVDEKAHH